jgi:hypothetical protein
VDEKKKETRAAKFGITRIRSEVTWAIWPSTEKGFFEGQMGTPTRCCAYELSPERSVGSTIILGTLDMHFASDFQWISIGFSK